MTRVRIDKWLWAARFFKTRTLAARACELGRISSNGQSVKAAREVRIGDLLDIKTEGGTFQVNVAGLSEMRGPAPVAQTLYVETEASKTARAKETEERRAMQLTGAVRDTKPSKHDRRRIARFRSKL